jgi:hypothetical protein
MNLAVFGAGRLQDCLALLAMADEAGIDTIAGLRLELAGHLARQTQAVQTQATTARVAKKEKSVYRGAARCGQCGAWAVVERVNVCASTRVGGNWRASITCTNPSCRHCEMSEKQVKELVL